MLSRSGWLVTLLFAVGCGASEAPTERSSDRLPFRVSGADEELGQLTSFRWNGEGEVAVEPQAEYALDPGAPGATDDALLLWRFEPALDTAAEFPWSAEELDGQRVSGRFGAALEVRGSGPALQAQAREGSSLERPFALAFWIWVDRLPAPGTRLLELPDCLHLAMLDEGQILLTVEGAPRLEVFSAAKLREGEWNFVGFALDGPELPQARLVVNGAPRADYEGPGPPPPAATRLVLGSAGLRATFDDLVVRSFAETSQDLIERYEAPRGSVHELTLRYASGQRTVEHWTERLLEPVLGGDAWRRGELVHAGVEDGALVWAPANWERIATEVAPLPRTTHPTVFVGKHTAWLFGGETRDSHAAPMINTADTWLFHTRAGRWERVETPIAPPARCHQASAFSPDHDLIFLAGGFQNEQKLKTHLLDTWVYHVSERRWEPRAEPPPAISRLNDCGVVYYPPERVFLVFRGRQVLRYDPESDQWRPSGKATFRGPDGEPEHPYNPSSSPITGYDPDTKRVVLFGGQTGQPELGGFQDTTALYDPATNTFEVLALDSAPSPRVRSGLAYDSNKKRFVLFGGVREQTSTRERDLWTFSPSARAWQRLVSANTPTRRGGFYGMAYDPALARFFLLAGRHDVSRFSNEAWSLTIDETAQGRARYVFDRQAFPDRTEWFADVRASAPARVGFRFRTSEDAQSWGPWDSDVSAVVTLGARFVQVEVTLTPRPGHASGPCVERLGFGPAPAVSSGAERFTTTVAPFY